MSFQQIIPLHQGTQQFVYMDSMNLYTHPAGDRLQYTTGIPSYPVQQNHPVMAAFYPMMSSVQIPMAQQQMAPVQSVWYTSDASSTSNSATSSDTENSVDNQRETSGFGYSSIKKETSGKFKTTLCHHFTAERRCPMESRCNFAHGAHELRSSSTSRSKPLPPKPQTRSYKIELCKSYSNSGSGYCSFGHRCQFIHPEDGAAYTFKKDQELHGEECQELYRQREIYKIDPAMVKFIEDEINAKVRQRNFDSPKRANYYDFHHMTLLGADQYIFDIIHHMLSTGISTSWLETGKGNHSSGGISKIKKLIDEKYQGYYGASFVPDEHNEGILVLTIC